MKAESIVHTIFSQLDTSVNRKQKHEYTCTIHLGEGKKETAGKKGCRLDVMLGGLKPVENEHVNGKIPLNSRDS